MAVPKKRTSSARRDRRRAQHDKVTPPNVIACPNCGAPKLSHRVCGECGWYNQRAVFEVISYEDTAAPDGAPADDEA